MPSAAASLVPSHDNQALVSLAILKVNWDFLKKDYLENFVPIVAECVKFLPSEVIALNDLQAELKKSFGLELAQSCVKTILGRLKKRGYIRVSNHVFYRNDKALEALNFREVQQRVLAAHADLLKNLRAFCADRFGKQWSDEEADDALQAYLQGSEEAILRATISEMPLPDSPPIKQPIRFIVASFVQRAQSTSSPDFDHLETIIKGSMLANAIFLPDIEKAGANFRNTEIFFDTTFLVYALGYAGSPRKAPCTELLALLYDTGAELRCFRHTVDEIHGILAFCFHRFERNEFGTRYGPSIEYFLSEGYKSTDIQVLANRLERNLQSLHVKVVDAPSFSKHKFVIDEAALKVALTQGVGHISEAALDRDVASISAIMRLRGTSLYFRIEDCHALFVTTNTALAKASRDFFKPNTTPGTIESCVTDRYLTNLLWLKRPFHAPDLPRKRLIADCYAATQPADHLWLKYLNEIDKLRAANVITAEDVYLLRHSLEARTALMNETLGDEEAFTEGTVPEILQMVRRDIESRLIGEREEEAKKRREAETALEAAQLREKELANRIERKSQVYAAWTVRVVETILLILLFISTAHSFPSGLPAFHSSKLHNISFVAQALILLVGAIHLYWGIPLKAYTRRLEGAMARCIAQIWRRIAGFPANGPLNRL